MPEDYSGHGMYLRHLSPLIAIFVAVAVNYSILSTDHQNSESILKKCQCTVPTLLDHYAKVIAVQRKFELLANDECTEEEYMIELYENHHSLLRLILEKTVDITERSRTYYIRLLSAGLNCLKNPFGPVVYWLALWTHNRQIAAHCALNSQCLLEAEKEQSK